MKKTLAAMLLGLGIGGTSPANAAVIDFDSLGLAPNSFFSGAFTEDGFDLAFTSMFHGDGSDSTAPFEIEREALSAGILTITRTGGGTFTFESIDWQLEYGTSASIVLEGYLGGPLAGTDIYATGSFAYSTFLASALSGVSIDTLIIRADRDTIGGGAFDTLVLDPAAVPLPGTLALAGLGLAGLGWSRRRRA